MNTSTLYKNAKKYPASEKHGEPDAEPDPQEEDAADVTVAASSPKKSSKRQLWGSPGKSRGKRKMSKVSRVSKQAEEAGKAAAAEEEENAYSELVEYLRVVAQLAYEELAEFRSLTENQLSEKPEHLH